MDDSLKIKIEAYINGTMSQDEKIAFEQQLKDNSSLKKEVRLARQINRHLSNSFVPEQVPDNEYTQKIRSELGTSEAKELKKKLLEVKDTYKKDTLRKKSKKTFFLVAASIAILLVSSISLLFFNQDNSEKLFAQYYSTEDLPLVIKRDHNQTYLEKGVIAFNEAKYEQAIDLFSTYTESELDINPSVFIYSGIANWEINEYDKAIAYFDKMIKSNAIDRSKGLWFKALLYLKMKDKKNAKTTLLKLVENQANFNYIEANELLSKL